MSTGLEGAGPSPTTRLRHPPLAPKRRAGIGAQPVDNTNGRKSHQPGSYRHTVESMGQPYATLTTRKRA